MSQLEKDLRHRATKRELVWRYLTEHMGEWIDAHIIASPSVGGSEGLRRLREIRASLPPGYRIEMRRKSGPNGEKLHERQYRLRRIETPSSDCG
ncbi:MAG: hypothetical protein QJR01_08180 [Kyrpidia sp.]|nr:hypothetical protein [Kyrpidia sp.]